MVLFLDQGAWSNRVTGFPSLLQLRLAVVVSPMRRNTQPSHAKCAGFLAVATIGSQTERRITGMAVLLVY